MKCCFDPSTCCLFLLWAKNISFAIGTFLMWSDRFIYFALGRKFFGSVFIGESKFCKDHSLSIQTHLKFTCDPKAKWNTTVVHNHGGAMSPKPTDLIFDAKLCKVSKVIFPRDFLKLGFRLFNEMHPIAHDDAVKCPKCPTHLICHTYKMY